MYNLYILLLLLLLLLQLIKHLNKYFVLYRNFGEGVCVCEHIVLSIFANNSLGGNFRMRF